ncbi:hypothetical protein THICB1_20083 [Thiomonas arsenitoxydans]|uniref:Uncharacterized protein n=1 Tax=Thiomonas arsenitoxydans (strain DSM 22701 / CIP 110005 / 3As) TaxID=426114 RepID=A0ABP1Z7R6_THIA3|nr:hypothetical protein THICB1_20083 [Thiomonas arsenitoxydans]CQR34623.1 hypothetical protein ACO7_400094 [Thiomonas arsenitoxydans]
MVRDLRSVPLTALTAVGRGLRPAPVRAPPERPGLPATGGLHLKKHNHLNLAAQKFALARGSPRAVAEVCAPPLPLARFRRP